MLSTFVQFCPILSTFVRLCPLLDWNQEDIRPKGAKSDTFWHGSPGGGWGRHPGGGRGGGWERGARLELLDDDDYHGHIPQLHRHQHLRLPPLHLWWIHLCHMWQINWKVRIQCCSCSRRRGRFSNMPVMKDVKCIFYQKVANFTIYDVSKLTVLLHKCSALDLCLNSLWHGHKRHKRSHVEDQTGFTEQVQHAGLRF